MHARMGRGQAALTHEICAAHILLAQESAVCMAVMHLKALGMRRQAVASAASMGPQQTQARPRSGERPRIGVERVPGQDAPAPSSYGPGPAGHSAVGASPLRPGAPGDGPGAGLGERRASEPQGAGQGSGIGTGNQAGGPTTPMRRVRGGRDVSDEAGGAKPRNAKPAPAKQRGAPAKMQSIAEHASQGAPGKAGAADEGFGSDLPDAASQEAAPAREPTGASRGTAGQGDAADGSREPHLEQGNDMLQGDDMHQGDDAPQGGDMPQDDDMATDVLAAREVGAGQNDEQGEDANAGGHPRKRTPPASEPTGARSSGQDRGEGAGIGADGKEGEAGNEEQEEGSKEGVPQGVASDERMTAPKTPPGPRVGGAQPAQEAPPEKMTTAGEVAKQAPDEDELPEVLLVVALYDSFAGGIAARGIDHLWHHREAGA